MADLAAIERALRKADAAGDTEAARMLAAEYRRASNTQGTMDRGERFAHGLGNVAYGLAQKARKATELAIPENLRSALELPGKAISDEDLAKRQADYEARKPAGTDYASMAGEIAATLPLAFLGGGPTAAVAGGAIAGMAQPVVGKDEDFWSTTAEQAKLGSVGGLAGHVGGRILGAIFGGSRGATAPAGRALMKEGITPTPLQAVGAAGLEEKLQNVPFLGYAIGEGRSAAIDQANVAIYNRALGTIGKKSSGQVGAEGVAEVHNTLSAAYDELSPKLDVKLDNLVSDLGDLMFKADQYLPESKNKEFFRQLDTAVRFGNFKDAEHHLSYLATKYGASPNTEDQLLGDAFDSVLNTARESLAKQNPEYASRLRQINEGWKGFAIIRDAAMSAEKAGRDAFSPEEFSAAVARNALRSGKAEGQAAFAENRAFMQDLSRPMMRVLGRKYPDPERTGSMMTATLPAIATGIGAAATGSPLLGLAAAGAAAAPFMYRSKLLRQASAAAILKRPEPLGQLAAGTARAVGKGAAPGTGLVLSQAGATAAEEPDDFWNQRSAAGNSP